MSVRATDYAVVWREPAGPVASGKLVLEHDAVLLDGAAGGRRLRRRVDYADVAGVRIARGGDERINGRPTIVLERDGGLPLLVEPLGPGMLTEIAASVAELSSSAAERREQVAVVVPLKKGAVERARRLLADGPPFDPTEAKLERHHVFFGDREAVFVFEGPDVTAAVRGLLRDPAIWRATAEWAACVSGRPRLAEPIFTWRASAR